MSFTALPKHIKGRGVDIIINSDFLTNPEALEAAARSALEKTAEAIREDVVTTDIFADNPEHNTIREYGGAAAYYSSGKVPFWRGGLLGSFQIIGSEGTSVKMAFTAAYAGIIEQGGFIDYSGDLEQWAADKLDVKGGYNASLTLRAHPFIEAVAMKIEDNLETFGYLDVFAHNFTESFK